MKCTKCGKEQAEKINVCPYCGFRFPKETKEVKDSERSTLIEFPSTSTRGVEKSARQTPISSANGDWRAELSAKVRQVRERRNLQEARGRLQAELEAAAQRYQQANPQALATMPNGQASISGIGINSDSDADLERPSNPVVEAALKRVQRASEMAVKVQQQVASNTPAAAALKSIPQTTQALPQPQAVSKVKPIANTLLDSSNLPLDLVSNDNDTALASKIDFEGLSILANQPPKMLSSLPKVMGSSVSSPPIVGATAVALPLEIEEEIAEQAVVPVTEEIAFPEVQKQFEDFSELLENDEEEQPKRSVRVIRESDVGPNYLDELVAVCQQNLSSEKANSSQSLIASCVDLMVIAIASSVFWGTSYVLGVNLADQRITMVLAGTSIFIGLVYLTLMVFVAARTLGMMFVGTRVINSNTNESPSIAQALIRAFGYFLSLGLVGLGFIWMFFDHDRRTLHDILSSTLVVRDY